MPQGCEDRLVDSADVCTAAWEASKKCAKPCSGGVDWRNQSSAICETKKDGEGALATPDTKCSYYVSSKDLENYKNDGYKLPTLMDAAFTLCTAVWGVPELAASCAVVQGLTKMFEGAGADKIKENVSAFGILIHKRTFINPREENNNGKVELMWYLPL